MGGLQFWFRKRPRALSDPLGVAAIVVIDRLCVRQVFSASILIYSDAILTHAVQPLQAGGERLLARRVRGAPKGASRDCEPYQTLWESPL